jgi:hypothetical protein
MAEIDGWNYTVPILDGGDARKIVTLEEDGMIWVGIRAWHGGVGRWLNNNEPERAKVIAWQELPAPARGWWDRGQLRIPKTLMVDPKLEEPKLAKLTEEDQCVSTDYPHEQTY